jgi:hypothetical protein
MDYNTLLKNAKSGDILLFKTHNSYDLPEFIYYRMIVTLVTQSDWSHVGLVIRCPYTSKLYIYESSEEPSYDYMTGKIVSGIKLSNFTEKIKNYNGTIGYRKLKNEISSTQCKYLYKLCFKNKNIPFRKKIINDNGINCAEAVSQLLKDSTLFHVSGMLKMVPCAFSSSCNYDSNHLWTQDYTITF